jgi:NADH-quinone oxidoreductase subunit L
MEGPTPVSSIIHSATMVVAGVFLTARMFPLFSEAAGTLALVQFIGAFTALFAAIIAITQLDIKRILAFSTLSQLGYMLFSLGIAKMSLHGEPGTVLNSLGYSAAMFHVFTHAFFKCMLFLGAGAMIHAVHSNSKR